MNPTLLRLVALIGLIPLSQLPVEAQISFGVNRQNGVVTGGGFQVGGFIMPGGMGVRLGVSAGANQLIGLQNFTFQNNNNMAPAGRRVTSQPPPKFSAGQFVKATKRFDKNDDGQIDAEELDKLATAVVDEFRKLTDHNNQTPATQVSPQNQGKSTVSAEQMVEAFVKQSMTFDKDQDGSLNSTETKRMAAALTRSLNGTAVRSG